MEGRRTFAIRFKWTNSGEDRFSVQQSRLLKYFCFSLFFFLCIFFFLPPIFNDIRTKTQNTERNAACRPYLIGRALRCRYIFRSARLETAVCAHQRSRPDRNFIALRETVGRPFAKKFIRLPPNYFGNRSNKLKFEGRGEKEKVRKK